MPSVSVKDPNVKDIGDIDDDASKLLFKKAQEDARMLTKGLARRQEMLLDCGRRLTQYQAAYLKEGEAMIKPLSMAVLADEMGVHKSTISRVVADKLVDNRGCCIYLISSAHRWRSLMAVLWPAVGSWH